MNEAAKEKMFEALLRTVALIVGLMLAFVFQALHGCASYARTPAPDSPELDRLAVSYELEEGEGDDELVEVSIGEMRLAVATAERYEDAVHAQNNAVDMSEVMYEHAVVSARACEVNIERAYQNTIVGFLGGGLVGVLLTLIFTR